MVTGVIAIAILTLVFVGATNLVVDEYAKGAIRTVVDEAAQQGAASGGSINACQAEATKVRSGLLPGPFGNGVQVNCTLQGDVVVAAATGYLPSLVPPVPRARIAIDGFSVVNGGG